MIVWGGFNGNYLNNGGRYLQAANIWTATPATAPVGRRFHTAIWTGAEMIVWGGERVPSTGLPTKLNDGARYDPVAHIWTPITTNGAPSARIIHTAVWTGSEMIVWGGLGAGALNDGGRYNPAANSWTAVTTNGAPDVRYYHSGVWTGTEMIVWGGFGGANNTYWNDGGRYNPASDSWTLMLNSLTNTPGVRRQHSAVWTGSEMIVWGGRNISGNALNDGGRYNPGANSWAVVTNASDYRFAHTAVWTGTEMIVWGGTIGGPSLNTGGRYNPVANGWTPTSINGGTPSVRNNHSAVWTGTEMIIWGGTGLSDGARYNPVSDSWTPTNPYGAPGRSYHTAVWTGTEMIIFGGAVNDGGGNPTLGDTWSYIPGRNMFLYQRP
jgi:hypothetical protein